MGKSTDHFVFSTNHIINNVQLSIAPQTNCDLNLCNHDFILIVIHQVMKIDKSHITKRENYSFVRYINCIIND
jgi:hypothetical protein